MFTDLQNIEAFPTTTFQIVANILVALICGLFIAFIYRRTYKGPGYSIAFVNAIVLLTMITALVLLTIGNNLARAFGLVGAMSIIRFRTAVKETQDIVYIFFALAVGMAAGVGYHKVAFIGTLLVGLVMYCFARRRVAAPSKEEYLLQFAYSPNGNDEPAYLSVFRRHCHGQTVINTRSLGVEQDALEMSYYVRLRDKEKNGDFVRELQRVEGVRNINLYFDEEQF